MFINILTKNFPNQQKWDSLNLLFTETEWALEIESVEGTAASDAANSAQNIIDGDWGTFYMSVTNNPAVSSWLLITLTKEHSIGLVSVLRRLDDTWLQDMQVDVVEEGKLVKTCGTFYGKTHSKVRQFPR